MSDWELIQQYAKSHSEAAFAELVNRHLAWVYSAAFRQAGNPQLAEEVAQSVFVLLARKAGSLRSGTVLGGWLFRTTRFVASRARRAESRRMNRHHAASLMTATATFPDNSEAAWEQLAPQLEQAVAALSASDRAAILLRFYEKKPLQEIGQTLGISEDAAKKRVSRAVDKLRTFLARRGVTLGAAGMISLLSIKTVEAAPVALATGVLNAAAVGVSASPVLPQLARETLRAWHWAKVKLAAGFAAASVAVIFMTVIASGLFTRRAASETASTNNSQPANITSSPSDQAAGASSTHGVNNSSSPKKTGVITGLVLDDQGHPVWGADVWGGNNQQPFARDTTDQSGQFALDKTGAPNYDVTVTVDGFAADQQEFDATNLAGPMVFHLTQVPPLSVRLVDESGHGVAGVGLFLYRWWGRPGTLGQYAPVQTDAEGRLKWLSAPKGELELQFSKLGYRSSRTNKFAADGLEHLIVLHPSAKVHGSVTDADTGAPIPAFKFTQGHAQPWNPTDETPMWDYRGKPGSNGFYEVIIEEEPRPYLRLEADGYQTFETELRMTNEIEDVCDFQLTRRSAARGIRGTVLLPDGNPAAGIEVALCAQEVGVVLRGTSFEPGTFGSLSPAQGRDYRRKTDQQGAFSFDPKPGAHTVVAVSPAGLGQAHCLDHSQPLEIHLQPWGRIEGTVRTRDGNWGGRTVAWNSPGKLTRWMTLLYKPESFSTRSDETGAFTLEHVPPGTCSVGADGVLSPAIDVNPGETAHVQIGGVGRAVTGKLVAPPDTAIRNWPSQVVLAFLNVESGSYEMPKTLTGDAAERWKLEFEDTPAGRAWLRAQYSYNFKVAADASFSIPEVLPGKYRLFVNVVQGNLGSGPDTAPHYPGEPQIAFGGLELTIPDASGGDTSPVNLGEIILNATQ